MEHQRWPQIPVRSSSGTMPDQHPDYKRRPKLSALEQNGHFREKPNLQNVGPAAVVQQKITHQRLIVLLALPIGTGRFSNTKSVVALADLLDLGTLHGDGTSKALKSVEHTGS